MTTNYAGLDDLDVSSEEFLLEEVGCHIQENLEDEIVKQALESGVDLRQYSKHVESELNECEKQSINDYVQQSVNVSRLYKQIHGCDEILARMESILRNFHEDLGSISSDIQELQNKSMQMHIRLQNRQSVRGELSQFVAEMVVPEQLINHILDTPVTERQFLEQLHELDHKIKFVREQAFCDARSVQDVNDILEKLKIKAISKIREFLLQKIYSFRKPMTNYQIPQNLMLKFRFYNEFLMANERTIAKEIKDEYVETTSKVYYSYFKTYSSKLMKLQFDSVADKDDLMGSEEVRRSSMFQSKSALKNKSTVFSLGNRGDIISQDLEAPVILPHAAQKSDTKYTFESLFRSLHYALLDNCCREYLFLGDFFMLTSQASHDLFMQIMGKALHTLQKQMETYIDGCYDAIALMLCMQIVQQYRWIMRNRCVPALDNYWSLLMERMWPRWERVVHMNIESLVQYDPHAGAPPDLRPHVITRRYAEFVAAMHTVAYTKSESSSGDSVSIKALDDTILTRVKNSLTSLQQEIECLLQKLIAELPHRKDRLVFLINNYDLILCVVSEHSSESSSSLELSRFKELMTACVTEYIDDVLAPYFGSLISFVKEVESRGDAVAGMQISKNEEARVLHIIKGFNIDWKSSIEKINGEIMNSFTNFNNGTQIFQGVLAALVQYYHRLQKVMSQPPYKTMPAKNELVNIHHIMVEIKKLKPNF